ncbi:hypothetical protein Tco_0377717 [Tanacetum coccineum]
MVKRNHRGHLIRRFAGRGNEPDSRDVKIASLKQQIQELECRQEKAISERAWETLNKESPFSYVFDRGNHRGGVRKETLCRLRFIRRGNKPDSHDVKIASLKQQIQELERRQERDISKRAWETQNRENQFLFVSDQESMPVYDTDIEDVIEEEEGFVRKGGFGGEKTSKTL